MIEKELLPFPLEGNDKFIAEMKTFKKRRASVGTWFSRSTESPGCVPGMARLLYGDV